MFSRINFLRDHPFTTYAKFSYQRLRHIKILEIFVYVLNDWTLILPISFFTGLIRFVVTFFFFLEFVIDLSNLFFFSIISRSFVKRSKSFIGGSVFSLFITLSFCQSVLTYFCILVVIGILLVKCLKFNFSTLCDVVLHKHFVIYSS